MLNCLFTHFPIHVYMNKNTKIDLNLIKYVSSERAKQLISEHLRNQPEKSEKIKIKTT